MPDEPKCALANDRWWSGWPGAVCQICGREDPRETGLADGLEDNEILLMYRTADCPYRT